MLKKFREQWMLRRNLRRFREEMENNLERFYVMEQRQFITQTFVMDAWVAVRDFDLVKSQPLVLNYAQVLMDFNSSHDAYKTYETWYASDIKHKTPDNARQLHSLKHALDLMIKTLEAIIIPAGKALEQEMVSLGLLKI